MIFIKGHDNTVYVANAPISFSMRNNAGFEAGLDYRIALDLVPSGGLFPATIFVGTESEASELLEGIWMAIEDNAIIDVPDMVAEMRAAAEGAAADGENDAVD